MSVVPYINNALKQFEDKHEVKVIFASDAGSRSYGWASSTSDFDVHLIYVHNRDYYLTIQEREKSFNNEGEQEQFLVDVPRNLLEQTTDETLVQIEVNIASFDVRHALQLFARSNPAVIHMLVSPIVFIDKCHEQFSGPLQEMCKTRCSRRVLCSSMTSLAKVNFRNYIINTPVTEQPTVRVKVYLYLVQHLFFVQKIFKETCNLPEEDLEIVTIKKGKKDIHFTRRKTPYTEPLPSLDIQVLLDEIDPIPHLHKVIQELVRFKKHTSGDPLVSRQKSLELYLMLMLRKLDGFAYNLPRIPEIPLGELDIFFRIAYDAYDSL
jgi:hypothetical protein